MIATRLFAARTNLMKTAHWSMPFGLNGPGYRLSLCAVQTFCALCAQTRVAMLVKEQNDYLTQTGAGTPMGQFFRSYWIPALLAGELPEPDCPPVRIQLLSERLIAFRDTEGRLGLIEEFCAHRRVSLWFGRNEEN